MFSTGTIRAVNPTLLAHISGVTKVPAFAAPIAPVIRPQLLTGQLMGCTCHMPGAGPAGLTGFIPPDYGSLRGMGKGEAVMWNRWDGRGLHGMGKGEAVMWNRWSGRGLHGVGDVIDSLGVPSQGSGNNSIMTAIATGVSFIPGIGQIAGPVIATLGPMIKAFSAWLGVGAGRREADLIVPQQNNVVAQLGTITNQFLIGTTPSAPQLISLYTAVWMLGVGFAEFVLGKAFHDRRASGQALNTVFPYIDGSCGYAVPLGMTAEPTQHNCMRWGDGTLGQVGTDGMLGALSRAIVAAGASPPVYMNLMAAANGGIPPQQASSTGLTPAYTSGTTSSGFLSQTVAGIPIEYLLIGGLLLLMFRRGS